MGRFLLFLASFLPLVCFCNGQGKQFFQLMGDQTQVHQYIQTQEDTDRLFFFEKLFQKQKSKEIKADDREGEIPKILHFIWLGPEPCPPKYTKYLKRWIETHPKWKIQFWTDSNLPVPFGEMEGCRVKDLTFSLLEEPYYEAVHLAEKAKILAYEILLQRGGVYVDHRVVVCKALDGLNEKFDFYCGLSRLGPSVLSSSIYPSSHLIAIKPGHPVMKETALWLASQWERLEKCYPGTSKMDCVNRIWHRTLWALSEGIDRGIDQGGNNDVVFPSNFFSESEQTPSSYTTYERPQIWSGIPKRIDTLIRNSVQEAVDWDQKILRRTVIFMVLSFFGWIFIFIYAGSIKREA